MINLTWLLIVVVALIVFIGFLYWRLKKEDQKYKKIMEIQSNINHLGKTFINAEQTAKNLDEAFGDLKTKLTSEKIRLKFHPGGGCKYRCPFKNKVIGIGSMLCFACYDHIDHGKDCISEWLICLKLANYEGDLEQIPEESI